MNLTDRERRQTARFEENCNGLAMNKRVADVEFQGGGIVVIELKPEYYNPAFPGHELTPQRFMPLTFKEAKDFVNSAVLR